MFAKIKYPLNPDANFWIANPQFKFYPPFSELYNRDNSVDKKNSSKEMYFVAFMCDPDEEENIFFRINEEQRMETLKETFAPEIDVEDALFRKCLEAYPLECLTTVQRSLKVEKDQLHKRALLISSTELTLDQTQILNGKSLTIKGTAGQINALQKDFSRIMDNYAKAEERFIKEKTLTRVKGGSKLSKSEQDGFWD